MRYKARIYEGQRCIPSKTNQPLSEAAKGSSIFLRVGFESHEARAIRRTSNMTDAA
jgi:hypothetical protein